VLLSGEGGDEAFGGYHKYKHLLLLERLKSICGPAKGLLQIGMELAGSAGWRRVGKQSGFVDRSLSEYYFSCTATPDTPFNRLKKSLYRVEFAEAVGGEPSDRVTRHLFREYSNLPILNQMLGIDTRTWLPDDLLTKADKMTMATSVELRVPLLDFKLLEFAASLPTNFKATPWATKRILKAALRDSVPQAILERKKAGFPVPYSRWLRNELKDLVCDTLLNRDCTLQTYFRKEAIRGVIERHQRGDECSQEVFSLLVLELWHKEFVTNLKAIQPVAAAV
jgi:asparagine synthase (glutamine-hydrolysing)